MWLFCSTYYIKFWEFNFISIMKNDKKNFDYLFKSIIVGNSAVGKTNIILRFTEGIYKSSYMSTIGVDFKIKTLDVDGKRVRLQVWDTAGQCRFQNIVKTYFQGSSGILFVNFTLFRYIQSLIDNLLKISHSGWVRLMRVQRKTNKLDSW